ncbi:recombinase family protein [Piscirickettsia salmonis]|uniref:recombinase family protein n=1 Tax=Piscirickettsia salmonis TaxID=1238 RepID=UPI0002FE9D17|nr:recombinase family protein [Piscirickettsia salmonis]APS59088.1 resolvase [Piscirickettsia salmonis]ERL61379.1 resolvase, N terminal domain protein [Piscirickettsia salmonis LF-89 = ATCC VR-1361]PEQ16282.1 resolvase [Piscirickettsia salmonis]QGN79236.1 DNA-invertase hin [Piscirickettsia salmonis]QGN82827.1 DNA-invertase hin [Piscirickettsia salmonis]
MALVGYARVSSYGQNLESQIKKLQDYGCKKIYQEKVSGVDQNRQELKNCLDYLRDEDTLVVTKLDRLARSNTHLNQIVESLIVSEINLVVLDQKIDTRSALGKMMYQLLGVFAEFENNIRKERQTDGIRIAKAKGVKFGRKRQYSNDEIESMIKDRESGMTIKLIIEKYKISKASFYRLCSNKV